MTVKIIERVLVGNGHPGRGTLLGKAPDGAYILTTYFIVGRSEDSRNRVFVREGDGLRTQAFDPSKLSDPSLIIYVPVHVIGTGVIVTNGDQANTVHDFLHCGETFEDALRSRTFESSEPNFTPRVSGWMDASTDFVCRLPILKSADGDPSSVQRMFFEYETLVPGQGYLIHTYRYDDGPIPSSEGELVCVSVPQELEEFTQLVWNSLNTENRASLFAHHIRLSDGETETRIINRSQ